MPIVDRTTNTTSHFLGILRERRLPEAHNAATSQSSKAETTEVAAPTAAQQIPSGASSGGPAAPLVPICEGEPASAAAANLAPMRIPSQLQEALQHDVPYPQLITERTPPYKTIHVNAAWCRQCGYRADDLIGRPYSLLLGPAPAAALASKKVVGLYFSAHWCPPCRGFTPKLADAYRKISADKSFEIVFVSSDRDEAAFASYYKEMPWLALPFAERELKQKLSKQFKVSGIPSLILLDGATGKVLSKDGRSVVMNDPDGADFPWAPKTLGELLGDVVVDGEGKELPRAATLQDKHVALYFSAHWCPPCKRFTPELAKTYAAIKAARDDFELVFVSGDRDAEQYKEYFATMPWLALPFDEKRYEGLSSHFEVEGIPTLVLLSPEGKVITTKGRAAVSADPEGKEFPNWGPKPVNPLEQAAGDLNESPALIVLCEKASAEEKTAIATALKAPADAVFAAAAAADAEPEMVFAIGEAEGNVAAQVRRLTKLEEGKGVAMLLLDIPDDGAYYVWKRPEGAGEGVTEADVTKFIADYKAKSLERRQLS